MRKLVIEYCIKQGIKILELIYRICMSKKLKINIQIYQIQTLTKEYIHQISLAYILLFINNKKFKNP